MHHTHLPDSEELMDQYLGRASDLVHEWMSDGYRWGNATDSAPYDDPVPFGILVVRPRNSLAVFAHEYSNEGNHHGANGGSGVLIPEVHFWHDDDSLVVVRGYPIEWEVKDTSALEPAGKAEEPMVLETYKGFLVEWAREGYPCCRSYQRSLADGRTISGKVYAHEHPGEESRTPEMFPEVYAQIYPTTPPDYSRGAPAARLGRATWRPVRYWLLWGGQWVRHPDPIDCGDAGASSTMNGVVFPLRLRHGASKEEG